MRNDNQVLHVDQTRLCTGPFHITTLHACLKATRIFLTCLLLISIKRLTSAMRLWSYCNLF